MPIRAVCSVSMEEMPGEPFKQNPTSGGFDVRRVRRTWRGTRWPRWPGRSTATPTQWRALAAYNAIDDPMRLPVGMVLMLPTPEELAR